MFKGKTEKKVKKIRETKMSNKLIKINKKINKKQSQIEGTSFESSMKCNV